MAIQFDDDFGGYSIGDDPPAGWNDLGFFKGAVVAAFDGQSGNAYHIQDGPISYGELGGITTTPSTTVVWIGYGDQLGVSQIIGMSTNTVRTDIAYVTIEPDKTASIYLANQPGLNVPLAIANTAEQVYHHKTWQTWQVTWSLIDSPISSGTGSATTTIHYIGVFADLWVDGLHVAGGFGVGGIVIPTSPLASAQLNRYYFGHPDAAQGGGGWLKQIWATTDPVGTATFPHIGSPPGGNARVTQGMMEVMKLQSKTIRHARMTQGAVELIELPNPNIRHIRITQGVVEVIKRGGSIGGWIVYEA